MLEDLRDYLNLLDEKGLLHKVNVEVDPVEEVPEVLRRLMWRRFDKAVLFEKLKGYPDWKVAGNLFGSTNLIKLALGTEELEELGERFLAPFKASGARSFGEKVKTLMEFINMGKYLPKKVRKGPVLENEKEPDFLSLPAFKTWPKDASRYLTYALTVTKDPESGTYNFGIYRIMIYSPKRAVIHWQVHKRGASHYAKYKELGFEKMPVAIVIGGDPATLLTGALPVPEGIDKYAFAGVLRGSPVKVVEVGDLLVPAYAEAVITGYVKVGELAWEGPFGDHTGYYTPRDLYPVFHAEKFFVRTDPIYYGTVVGRPPMEDAYIGKATERIFLPLIKWLVPEVIDMNLPPEGLFHGIAIVSIRKKYPGHARKVAHALLGLGQMSFTKIVIVVDQDVNVHDWGEVAYAIASTVDPERDVEIIRNDVTDVLDHTSPSPPAGSKMIIDATRKFKEECGYEWPERSAPDPKVSELVERRWREYGF
ncbi:UbiD family decarboxylase [Ignicoccus hospitalis]|uniref:UbiD family decarboxylase n=1 Tax=Ignicoccus hospitalis TaxID=160233 RepID=UPI0011D04EB3|nr:UbiD family decarboxylase [Ignicoccus hospitalis]HIH90021.1 UbiD family decarboxylase [Desulfurococcaceae archaeon]